MKKKIRERSLGLESLEDRMLLAVTAGDEGALAEYAAPAETGAEIVCDVTFNALRQAINKASAGDTIVFNGSGTITITSALPINKNITIDGGGDIVFQGAGENILFSFGSGATDVTFTGLDLTGGYSTTNGMGGIAAIGAGRGLTLNNCNIYGNTAGEGGRGGAFVVTGQLNMNNCSVYANGAEEGGFAYISGRDEGNHAATGAAVNALNCNFYGNTAVQGGVFYNWGGTLNLTNCSVVGNTAESAIHNLNGFICESSYREYYICDTTVINSIVAYNNGADQAAADICEEYQRRLTGAGVLQWEQFNIDDTFSKFNCENSIIGMRGDYFVAAPTFDDQGNLDLDATDLTIRTDSVAAWAGIGANPDEYTGTGVDDYLVVTTLDDIADGSDGVVSLREALEYATLGTFDAVPMITFASDLSGGTIALTSGQLVAIASVNIIADGVTVDAGGKSRVLFAKSFNYQADIEGNYENFEHVADATGAICPVHNFSDYNINVTIDGLSFTGGAATAVGQGSGGAGILALQNVMLNLSNSSVSDSVLKVTIETSDHGDYNTTRIRGDNYANNGGGGIAATLYSGVVLDHVNVTDNTVLQVGDRGDLEGEHKIILTGGGIFVGRRSSLSADTVVVSGNELTSEHCQNGDWGFYAGYGGGIGVFGTAEISDSEILANSITGCGLYQCGGGIYSYISDPMLAAAHAVDPSVNYGLVLTSTSVTGNSVGDHSVDNNGFCYGGGIYNAGPALLVNDLITDNTLDAGSTTGATLSGHIEGAGIYNGSVRDSNSQGRNNSSARMDIYYCTITNNTAACVAEGYNVESVNWGGGIYNAVVASWLQNPPDGSAAHNVLIPATINLTGSILYHNYVQNSTDGTLANSDSYNVVDGDVAAVFNMSNVLYNKSGIKGSGINYGDNCIAWLAMYKVFNDEVAGDYTLWTGTRPSQALNALSADAATPPAQYIPAYDLHGEPWVRVYGEAQDFGCYEYQPAPAPTFQITIVDYVGDYDGQAHTVTLNGLEEGDVVTYSADGETYSSDVVAYTDPGTYTVYVRVARDGYQDFNGSGTVTINGAAPVVPLAAPTITTGRGVYVSYGANRHLLQWSAVENASGYEVAYTDGGTAWTLVSAEDTSAVIRGLTYGLDVDYKVRALGDGVSYADSDWSAVKTFNVCPMDINNDGDISGGDRTLLANSWLSEEGDDEYRYYADINGDGDIGGADRAYLSNNWLGEVGNDDLQYPPAKRADAFFADFASADLDVDLGAF